MIALITFEDEESGKTCVSHGVDTNTLENVVLPQEPLHWFDTICLNGELYLK